MLRTFASKYLFLIPFSLKLLLAIVVPAESSPSSSGDSSNSTGAGDNNNSQVTRHRRSQTHKEINTLHILRRSTDINQVYRYPYIIGECVFFAVDTFVLLDDKGKLNENVHPKKTSREMQIFCERGPFGD